MKNRRRGRIGVWICIVGLLVSLLSGCGKRKAEPELSAKDQREPATLKVYVEGDAVMGELENGEMGPVCYYTGATIGEYVGHRYTYGNECHMYYRALTEYQNESQDQLEVEWFPYPEEIKKRLLEDNQKGTMPDVIISTNSSYEDYKRWMQQGSFYDLSGFLEEEGLYNSDNYYQPVLHGGQLGGNQYLLPFLFTMDTLMGSKEVMEEYQLKLEEDMSLQEIFHSLQNNQQEIMNLEKYETMYQGDAPSVGYYTLHILYGAAGESWIDYEKKEETLNQELFSELAIWYQGYLQQEFGEKWEAMRQAMTPEEIDTKWAESKLAKNYLIGTQDIQTILDQIGCIAEGGTSYLLFLHSFAAQANYYESRFRDRQEEFWMMGIPEWENEDQYSAHISSFGAVMSGSQHPRAAYELLRTLMDEETFQFNGLSVNRELTEKTLDTLCETEYGLGWISGAIPDDEWKSKEEECYWMKPMSQETREKIEYMTERIGRVSVPEWPAYHCVYQPILEYAMGRLSLEEAYTQAVAQLDRYCAENLT